MKKLVHVLLIGMALLGSVSAAFADGPDPTPLKPPSQSIR
jgi:hypothetical protein